MSNKELVETAEKPVTVTTIIDTSPTGMLAHAMQNGASLDQLEKFMDLKERHEKTEAKKAYVTAMAIFRSGCPTIVKTKLVSYGSTEFMHSTLAGTIEQIKTLLAECGLSHSWGTGQESGAIKVTCMVTHSGGHSESTSLVASPDQSGGKNNIQAIGSTVKYLERYTLFAILGLADSEHDDDGNAATKEPIKRITAEQAANIQSIIDEIGGDIERRFLKWLQTDSISKIQAANYDNALAQLEKHRK